jgi:hypothetical protein
MLVRQPNVRFWGKSRRPRSGDPSPLLTDTVDKVGQETGSTLIFAFAGRWLTAPVGEAMAFLQERRFEALGIRREPRSISSAVVANYVSRGS